MAAISQEKTKQENMENHLEFPRLEKIAFHKVMVGAHIFLHGPSLKEEYRTVTDEEMEEGFKNHYNLVKLPKSISVSEMSFELKCLEFELIRWRLKIQWIKNKDRITANEVAWTPSGKISEEETFYNLKDLMTDVDAFVYASKLCLKNYLLGVPQAVRCAALKEYNHINLVVYWCRYCQAEFGEICEEAKETPTVEQILGDAFKYEYVSSVAYIWDILVKNKGVSEAFRLLLPHDITENEEICAFFVRNLPEEQKVQIFDLYNKQEILFALVRFLPSQNLIPSILQYLHQWQLLSPAEFYAFCILLLLDKKLEDYPVYDRSMELFRYIWDHFADSFVEFSEDSGTCLLNFLYSLYFEEKFPVLQIMIESEAYKRISRQLLFTAYGFTMIYFLSRRNIAKFYEYLGCSSTEIDEIWRVNLTDTSIW